MDNIEVTKKTFFTLFDVEDCKTFEAHELHYKDIYYNKEQRGFTIYNHISQVTQYYLTDINA